MGSGISSADILASIENYISTAKSVDLLADLANNLFQ